MIQLGNKNVSDIYLGDKKILQVYKGNELIWESRYTVEDVPYGIYIYSTDEFLYNPVCWDPKDNEKAVGVAVINENCKFVIAPDEVNSLPWGKTVLVPDCTTTTDQSEALLDFNGVENTAAIVKAFGNSEDYAAKFCTEYIFKNNKTGYLGAVGEWKAVHNNISQVNKAMSKIGGTILNTSSTGSYFKQTSTQQHQTWNWLLNFTTGGLGNNQKTNILENRGTRAFLSLQAGSNSRAYGEFDDPELL